MTNQLKAGFGKGEILFPAELFPVENFTGIHDNPAARLMVLESGEMKIAIAALEMVNVPEKGIRLCQDIIEEKTGTPRAHIWVHVTHAITTMHEPGPMGPPDRRSPETEEDRRKKDLFFGALEAAITQAAGQAADTFSEAKIGWGTGLCDVNINRDIEPPFGWWTGLNPEGPSNKTMTILRADGPDGTPRGFFISYGVKPCAIDIAGMETGDRLVSADVCGVCCRTVEERLGAPALLCVSAAADQVTKEQALLDEVLPDGKAVHRDYGVAKGIEIMERLRAVMGQDAVRIAGGIECNISEAEISHSTLSFPWKTKGGRGRGPAAPLKEYLIEGECQIDAEIFTLGDAAFVAEKPEVNCRTELELKANSPFAHTLLMSMINGGMKYMPDRTAYERNTFECQSSMLLPGAAEKFVEVVTARLNTLAGKGEN